MTDRKPYFFLAVLLLAIASLFAPPAPAQTTQPDVPKEQVAAKIQPFLGTWNFAVCTDEPYGVQIKVALKDNAPVVTLERLYNGTDYVIVTPLPFRTVDFISIPGQAKGTFLTWIDATNGRLLLTIFPAAGTKLEGHVTIEDGTVYNLFGQNAKDVTLDQYLASGVTALCHADKQQSAPATRKL